MAQSRVNTAKYRMAPCGRNEQVSAGIRVRDHLAVNVERAWRLRMKRICVIGALEETIAIDLQISVWIERGSV
jgi:hypothetical protein